MIRIAITLLTVFLLTESSAQINLKKFKERVKKTVEEVSDGDSPLSTEALVSDQRKKQLEKDTSFYNYIFSQGNRASFFANRESQESVVNTFAKNYESEDVSGVELEVYEKVFDLNRLGEKAIYISPDVATSNFLSALQLMITKVPSFDEEFVVQDLVNLDTMALAEKYAYGKTIANISILIHAEGNYRLAELYIEQSIQYFTKVLGANSVAHASLYSNHATVSQAQGRYEESENFYVKAEQVIKKSNRVGSLSHAIILNNKALLYNEIGQYDKALATMQKATDYAKGALRDKGRDNTSFQINKGLIYYSKGDYERAEQIFREVIELKRKRMAGNQTDVGNVKNYLAAVLMASGKTSEVPGLLNSSLEIFKKKYDSQHPAYIKTKHNLGRYHLVYGDLNEARDILNDVAAAYLNVFNESHPDYLSVLEDQAVAAWQMNDFAVAKSRFKTSISTNLDLLEKYFGAMSEHEKTKYWAKVRPSILKFYAFATARGEEDPSLLTDMYNLHLKTKGILLSASTKVRAQILNSNDSKLKDTYRSWVGAKENLLLYYSFSQEQLKRLEINLSAEEEKANLLEKELNRMSTAFAQSNKLPSTTLAEVKTALGATEAAVEIIGYPVFERTFTDGKNYAFLIADLKSVNPKLVLVENGESLDSKYAKAYLNMVKAKAQDRITYDKFWAKVDNQLAGYETVNLSLDGIYFQVNVGALKRPDNTFVSDNINLNLYSSTRDLVNRGYSREGSREVTLIGNPVFGNQNLIDPLPGTQVEIDAISKLGSTKGFKTNVYTKAQASEENFKSITRPSLLHIATHGFFLTENQISGDKVFGVDVEQANDNPLLRSGLMLANAEQAMDESAENMEATSTNNGILTAYEVMTLDLKDTDMVVLSACETGLGEIKSGEGVYGLQRSFQVAGAASVIMSLWKVSDEATKQLMISFYQNWMNGTSKGVAFSNAQKTLRESFPEPYYWGAFVMLN